MDILTNQAVVVSVCTNPEPDHTIGYADAQGSVTEAYSDRPELFDLFEVQGRVFGILFQQGKVGIVHLSDGGRRPVVAFPELRRSMVDQSGLHLPAAYLARASAA